MHFAANTVTWSEYLYEFYELDKNSVCPSIPDDADFYTHSEKEKCTHRLNLLQRQNLNAPKNS